MASLVFVDGTWHEGNPPILGALDHAFWMASSVFDGARAFAGTVPDLERHCARLDRSARLMNMEPTLPPGEIADLCRAGVRRLGTDPALYIRPMYMPLTGFVIPDPASTKLVIALHPLAMPEPTPVAVTLSPYRRPSRDMAPTEAKAGCLYPNQQRALVDAKRRGFGNAISLDANGSVAELATANIWMVRDGVALTPVPNGVFLNGITRQRLIALLRADGIEVREETLSMADFMDADEVFSSGNYGKVLPIDRIDGQHYEVGPVYRRARALYMEFARECPA